MKPYRRAPTLRSRLWQHDAQQSVSASASVSGTGTGTGTELFQTVSTCSCGRSHEKRLQLNPKRRWEYNWVTIAKVKARLGHNLTMLEVLLVQTCASLL